MSTSAVKVNKTIVKDHSLNIEKKNTIYVNNLNEKVPTSVLKDALYNFFSKFGVISSIKCFNSFFRKGQAWISFENVDSASTAIKNGNNINILGKSMRVSFSIECSKTHSKEKSDNETPMIPRSVRSRIELYKLYLEQWLKHVKTHKLIDDMLKGSREKQSSERINSSIWDTSYIYTSNNFNSGNLRLISKQYLMGSDKETGLFVGVIPEKQTSSNSSKDDDRNTTVFVQIVSGKCKEEDLNNIFQSVCGFKELRYVPDEKVAFVEFRAHEQAAEAVSLLDNFNVNSYTKLKLSFARKDKETDPPNMPSQPV